MPTDPTRRASLLGLKLRTLVRDHIGHELGDLSGTQPVPFGRGAALVIDGTAWLLLAEQPERSLGGALAWATRQPTATDSAIIADAGTGVLQRRAVLFDLPISVWHAVERMLV